MVGSSGAIYSQRSSSKPHVPLTLGERRSLVLDERRSLVLDEHYCLMVTMHRFARVLVGGEASTDVPDRPIRFALDTVRRVGWWCLWRRR